MAFNRRWAMGRRLQVYRNNEGSPRASFTLRQDPSDIYLNYSSVLVEASNVCNCSFRKPTLVGIIKLILNRCTY